MARRSPREWYEVMDPIGGKAYMFDVTFLLSKYNCIYGRGCQGGFNSQPQGCCGAGAYFETEKDVGKVASKIGRLLPQDNDRVSLGVIKDRWHTKLGGQTKTRKYKNACIFANTNGDCSLHKAALREGENPMDWKPDICWTIPLSVREVGESSVEVTIWDKDEHGGWNSIPGQAHNEGYWCAEDPAAYAENNTYAFEYFDNELSRLVPLEVWRKFVSYANTRTQAGMETSLKVQPVSVHITVKP